MAHDPLSPSEALRTRVGIVHTLLSLFVFVYSIAIVGQVLIGVITILVLMIGPYLSYRVFAVLDSIADAAQRFAAVREREVDRDARFDRPVDREGSSTRERSSERRTERER